MSENEELLRLARDLTPFDLPIGVYVVTKEGRFVKCNRRAREIFRLSLEGEIDDSIARFYPNPNYREQMHRELLDSEARGRPLEKLLTFEVNGQEIFAQALGVPTAIYSLIVDNDIKRVAQTRVKARRYFMVTGLLYAAAFILVWFIHPSPDRSPSYAPAQQEVPTPASTSRTSQTPEPSSRGELAHPFLQPAGRGTEQTAALQQAETDPSAVRQEGPEQKVPRQDAPQVGTPEQTVSPQVRQPMAPSPRWSLIVKSTFAAATVTILPFGVLIMGLRLNRQFKRPEVINRLADTLLETFETKQPFFS